MHVRTFDDIDLRILTELQRDGRMTFQDLSQIEGLSPRQCVERVRRLERAGIITGYTARVDLTRLGNTVIVIARILLTPGHDNHARFEQRIHGCPEVVGCFEVSGAFDYVVKVVSPSIDSYRELTAGWINDEAFQVERIESHVVLCRTKDNEVYPVVILEPRGTLS